MSPVVNNRTAENIQGIGVSGPFTGFKIIRAEGTIRAMSRPRKALGIKNAALPSWITTLSACLKNEQIE